VQSAAVPVDDVGILLGQHDRDYAERSGVALAGYFGSARELARWQSGSILLNRLIGPVPRISQHVRPELGHLSIVAGVAGVSEKNTAGIVLG
jgi:hypothetical protein